MDWQEAQQSWLLSLAAERRSPNTIDGYRFHLAPFNRWLEAEGVTAVEGIGPFHIRRFLVHYSQDHSPHSVRTVYASLRAWFRWLAAEGILKVSPTDKVKPPKAPDTSKKIYTSGELSAIKKCLEKGKAPLALRDYALVLVLMDTGARCSELLAVTLDDVQDGAILLRQTKGKRPRIVPLGKESERALWRYVQRGRPKLRPRGKEIFVSDEGRPMTRNSVRCMLKRLGAALGFPVSAHRFRHTWATMMLRKGADMEAIRKMGGWSDYAMLRTYAHLDAGDLRRMQERLSVVDGL
ncbi:MAG: tyrosine-type recombinase/integrase [Chloroflexota bacterium]